MKGAKDAEVVEGANPCRVGANTEKTEGHIFQDIENVTINHGLPDNKADMPAPIDSDTYTIAQLY